MKSERIIRQISYSEISILLLISLMLCFSSGMLYSQENHNPTVEIQLRKNLDYERPPRLEEEDGNKGKNFKFKTGLEIITDIESVKVYLFDDAYGRTPFEDNDLDNGYIRVKLEKPGYSDYSFWVNIKEDYRTTVHVYYKKKSSAGNLEEIDLNQRSERDSHPLYLNFNPDDPAYYRQLFIMNSNDSEVHYSAVLEDKSDELIYTLLPLADTLPFVFSWDGRNALGEELKDNTYYLQMDPGERYTVKIDRMHSRKAANYYSGTAGLLFVPTAQLLFPGGFQFGSIFSIDSNFGDGGASDYSLPFSFFVRFSPLKRWEASFETEVAFINESGEPSLRLNSSQKVFVYGNELFQVTLGARGSYKGAINDLEQNVQNTILRDPSGFSFFVPMQFYISNWDFMFSPEYMYTLTPPASAEIEPEFDMLAALKWGVSYSNALLAAGFSSALYFPSLKGNRIMMQVGVDASLYVPGTPLYINLFVMNQRVQEGDKGYSTGLNLGFLF